MKIEVIQSDLVWENAAANRHAFDQKIHVISSETDLIVLPEMFNTGFSMDPQPLAETMTGKTVLWMQNIASKRNCAITGSIIIKENGKYYNRLLFVFPDKNIVFYDKRHLFTLAGEHYQYTKGFESVVVNFRNYNICLLICYDLRFPVFSRNKSDYDLLLYVANWPSARIGAWDALLKARAIENMSYTIGVNRVGSDANGHQYCGHTQVVDYMGHYVLEPQGTEGVFNVLLDKQSQSDARKKFGFLNDADDFTINSIL